MSVHLTLTKLAIKNELTEICSIVRKGHKIKPKQPYGDYCYFLCSMSKQAAECTLYL